MKKKIIFLSIMSSLYFVTSCELLDPTEVVNPNLTDRNVLDTDNPMTAWVLGLERQTALVLNEYVVIAEIASDNYDNTQTFFNQNLDNLNIIFTDADINGAQFAIADLRESAVYGINVVKPADENTTPDQEAELYFYKGFAELLAGELFVALPAVPNGAAETPEANLMLAIDDFETALQLTTDASKKVSYNLALARAHYNLGNATEAQQYASAAVAGDANFVRFVRFDGANNLTNEMEDAIFDRNTFDDLQPLPRLDFLDPKYHGTGSEEMPIAIQKIEEAHLILAEAALASNMLSEAKESMKNAIAVVNARQEDTFNDQSDQRTQDAPGSRPNVSDISVAASATDPLRTGLVLNREGDVTVPTVSGTSVSAADVDALTTEDEALETLYLMRQEIFIAEGRRMVDLGIRFPVSEIEALSNPLITTDQTQGFAPTFIPRDGAIDRFTFNAAARTAVIEVNLNEVLVANKNSPEVLPFH